MSILSYFAVDAEFGVKLDEISEHYRKHGVCKGDECNRFFMQVRQPDLSTGHRATIRT